MTGSCEIYVEWELDNLYKRSIRYKMEGEKVGCFGRVITTMTTTWNESRFNKSAVTQTADTTRHEICTAALELTLCVSPSQSWLLGNHKEDREVRFVHPTQENSICFTSSIWKGGKGIQNRTRGLDHNMVVKKRFA